MSRYSLLGCPQHAAVRQAAGYCSRFDLSNILALHTRCHESSLNDSRFDLSNILALHTLDVMNLV